MDIKEKINEFLVLNEAISWTKDSPQVALEKMKAVIEKKYPGRSLESLIKAHLGNAGRNQVKKEKLENMLRLIGVVSKADKTKSELNKKKMFDYYEKEYKEYENAMAELKFHKEDLFNPKTHREFKIDIDDAYNDIEKEAKHFKKLHDEFRKKHENDEHFNEFERNWLRNKKDDEETKPKRRNYVHINGTKQVY